LTEFFISHLGGYFQTVEMYQQYGFHEVKPNPLSIHLIIDWVVIFGSLMNWKKLSPLMKRIIFIELIGMSFFYGCIKFGVIAHRVRELFSVFWVFFCC